MKFGEKFKGLSIVKFEEILKKSFLLSKNTIAKIYIDMGIDTILTNEYNLISQLTKKKRN